MLSSPVCFGYNNSLCLKPLLTALAGSTVPEICRDPLSSQDPWRPPRSPGEHAPPCRALGFPPRLREGRDTPATSPSPHAAS